MTVAVTLPLSPLVPPLTRPRGRVKKRATHGDRAPEIVSGRSRCLCTGRNTYIFFKVAAIPSTGRTSRTDRPDTGFLRCRGVHALRVYARWHLSRKVFPHHLLCTPRSSGPFEMRNDRSAFVSPTFLPFATLRLAMNRAIIPSSVSSSDGSRSQDGT